MRQIKILHVIRPAEGGMKGHLVTLVRGLQEKGYQVEAACPGNSVLARDLAELDIPVFNIDLVGPLNLTHDLICIKQLREIFLTNQYDIIHFHGSKAGLVGRIASILAGCKNTVLTVHNFIIYREVPTAKKIIYRYGEKLLSRVTAKIITVSKALRDDLIDNYQIAPEKITAIYNGIDLSRYRQSPDSTAARAKYGIPAEAVVVGTVARMAPQKGLNYLIEAIPGIKTRVSQMSREADILFVLAGDGPLRPELQKLTGQLGIGGTVLFPGFVEDIGELFACLDIFVVPSIAEGLSITTMEAMAAGLPVIASRAGGLPELVRDGETGLLVEPRDPEGLAEAVARLISDPETRTRFGTNGRHLAGQEFGAGKMVSETCKVYDEILGL